MSVYLYKDAKGRKRVIIFMMINFAVKVIEIAGTLDWRVVLACHMPLYGSHELSLQEISKSTSKNMHFQCNQPYDYGGGDGNDGFPRWRVIMQSPPLRTELMDS